MDGAALEINQMIFLNIITVQTLKRFCHRKRPTIFQPPRALTLRGKDSSSGFPSRVVVAATTVIYGIFRITNWYGPGTDHSLVSF